MLFPIFSSYTPKWRCKFNDASSLPTLGSDSATFSKNCTVFQHCTAPNTIEFDHIYFHSAALEFNWICGSMGYLVPLFAQIQFCGVLIGTLFYGSLSDCFGRKPVAMFALSFGISMIVLSGFAPSWQILLVARFFVGLCIGGVVVVVYTWTMELVLPEHRIPIRSIFNWVSSEVNLNMVVIH
uniref:Major facilitator superfamily (MFS) profile domain-containing protein n=1 Tax=Ditylenchus dipsaci TaxID=166011 RepID=A0A915DWC9_9BILA